MRNIIRNQGHVLLKRHARNHLRIASTSSNLAQSSRLIQRSLFSTDTTPPQSTSEVPTTKNLLFLAPVVLSGLIGGGVVFYLATSSPDSKAQQPKNIAKSPSTSIVGTATEHHRHETNSGAGSSTTTTTTTTRGPRSASAGVQRPERLLFDIATTPRTNWTVGEKVDKKQFRERYEEIHSDKKGIHMIGRGAYGRVLSAISKGSEERQKVAMKVVSPSQMSAQALMREVEVLRRVRGHDNIIHLLEVLEFNGSWYLVTELCEGGDLLDRLIENGPYDEATCAAVIYNIASALDHVHRCGFVHLDVKPENLVFVSKGGTRGDPTASDVRLIDFGMAKDIASIEKQGGLLLRSSSSVVDQVRSNPSILPPRVGTIAYWAPEQIKAGNVIMQKGEKEETLKSDPRACDTWALGVIMYIMLFGCHPFDIKGEGNEKMIAEKILNTSARLDIHGDRVALSSHARDVLTGLLQPDPANRIKLSDLMDHPLFEDQRARKAGIDSQHSSTKLQRKRTLDRLPTSWKQAGFSPARTAADEAIDDPTNTFRIAPFQTLEATQALIQALLLAAVATAEEDEEQYRNSEALFRAAFDALDVDSQGVLTERSLNHFMKIMRQRTPRPGDSITEAMERAAARMSQPQPRELFESEPYITFDEFQALLRSILCVSRKFKEGEIVFEQGAVPQGVYLLVSGQAKVEWKPPSVDSIQKDEGIEHVEDGFATIPPGSIIGETAIVQGRMQRSATIRITEDSQVIFIPKQEFLLAVASSKALSDKIFALTNAQQARRVFQLVDRFNKGKIVHFNQGQVIFRQGEQTNSLYLVRKGAVELTVRGQASNKEGAESIHVRVGRRHQGDVVGVSAAHHHGKRSTSATCLTDVEAIKIAVEDLVPLLKKYPILRFYMESQKRWRNENWQKMLADVEKGVSEPQILPLLGEGVEEDQGKSFEEYQRTLAKAEMREYRAGDCIFQRGERSGGLFVIESGICDVEIRNDAGQIMTIAQLGPGDHIGEQPLLDGKPQYAFTVRCVTPVEAKAISEKEFFHLLGDRGHSNFARAVRVAMRQRRHLWVARLLNLAHREGATTQLIALNPDETLFRIGEPIDQMYFVHRGSFVVTRPDGTVVRTMVAGETIGWDVFKEGGISTATATCLSKAVVEALPKETLEELIQNHRYVSKELELHAVSSVPEFSQSTIVRKRSVVTHGAR